MASPLTPIVADLREALHDSANALLTIGITLEMTGQSSITDGLAVLTAGEVQLIKACCAEAYKSFELAKQAVARLNEMDTGPRGKATEELIRRLEGDK